jgi:hypothetical protein
MVALFVEAAEPERVRRRGEHFQGAETRKVTAFGVSPTEDISINFVNQRGSNDSN